MKTFALKKFVEASKTSQICCMSRYEKKMFIKNVLKKIPDITKEEFISICNSPAKIKNFI